MSLSIRDVLLLDFFNGKPVHNRVPNFQFDVYGSDANSRIQDLCEEGWIRHSRPQETLNMLPDKALSDFLLKYKQDSQGSHVELVRRIIEKIPENEYAHAVPKLFVVTGDGQKEISRNMAYVMNVRGNYGLTEGEIGESQHALSLKGVPFSANDILCRVFQKKASIFSMAGEWTKLRNLYFTMANFLLKIQREKEALSYLFLVFFMDMSGMENHNRVCRYENLFPTQKGIIILMKRLCEDGEMSGRAVKSFFLSSIARTAPRLPFSYFSPQIMGDILIDRLHGQDFNRIYYIKDKNTPDSTATAYHYVSADGDREKEHQQEHRPPAKSSVPPVPPVLRLPSFIPGEPFRPSSASSHSPKTAVTEVSVRDMEKQAAPLRSRHIQKKKNHFSYTAFFCLLVILLILIKVFF